MDLSKMSIDQLAMMAMHDRHSEVRANAVNELARRLEAAEADRDRWKAEALAWRNQAGVWLIVDGKKHWYIQDGNTLFEITEAAATDAARTKGDTE